MTQLFSFSISEIKVSFCLVSPSQLKDTMLTAGPEKNLWFLQLAVELAWLVLWLKKLASGILTSAGTHTH